MGESEYSETSLSVEVDHSSLDISCVFYSRSIEYSAPWRNSPERYQLSVHSFGNCLKPAHLG